MLEKDSLKKIVNLPNNTNEELTPISREYIEGLFDNLGDDSNPIDYYTKQQSDEKFATKSDVEANKASIANIQNELGINKETLIDNISDVFNSY